MVGCRGLFCKSKSVGPSLSPFCSWGKGDSAAVTVPEQRRASKQQGLNLGDPTLCLILSSARWRLPRHRGQGLPLYCHTHSPGHLCGCCYHLHFREKPQRGYAVELELEPWSVWLQDCAPVTSESPDLSDLQAQLRATTCAPSCPVDGLRGL